MSELPDDLDLDEDCYPDDAVLERIRRAPVTAKWMFEVFPKLGDSMRYSKCEIEDAQDFMGDPVKRITFHTGGWSGCEDFINAVTDNLMVNGFFYVQWKRGGHYTFEIPLHMLA